MAFRRVLSPLDDPAIPPPATTPASTAIPVMPLRPSTVGQLDSTPFRQWQDSQALLDQESARQIGVEPYVQNTMPHAPLVMPQYSDPAPQVQDVLRWLPLMNLIGGSQAGPVISSGFSEGIAARQQEEYARAAQVANMQNQYNAGLYDDEQRRVDMLNRGIDNRNTLERQLQQNRISGLQTLTNRNYQAYNQGKQQIYQAIRGHMRALATGGLVDPGLALRTVQQIDELNDRLYKEYGESQMTNLVPESAEEAAGMKFYDRYENTKLQNQGRVDAAAMYGQMQNIGRQIAGEYNLAGAKLRIDADIKRDAARFAAQKAIADADRNAANLRDRMNRWAGLFKFKEQLSFDKWAQSEEFKQKAAANGRTAELSEFQAVSQRLTAQQARLKVAIDTVNDAARLRATGGILFDPTPEELKIVNDQAELLTRLNKDIEKLSQRASFLASQIQKSSGKEEPIKPERTGKDSGKKEIRGDRTQVPPANTPNSASSRLRAIREGR